MLRFVLGRSGYGKSEYLRQRFAQLARDGEEKLLFIVPDQISFETEARFLDLLGPALSRNILVLGFSRLCDFVFDKTGNRFATFADDGVRHLMMSLALEQVSDSLTVFDKRSKANDMRELMLSAVKEYKKCAISSDTLREVAAITEDETLRAKLEDTALVYDAYNAVMERSYMDPLDSLTKVCELLTDNRLFESYIVALDAFYGFTAQEYDVIEQIMAMSKEMFVALTDDGYEDSESLFFVPRRTRRRLTRIARDHEIEVAAPIHMTTPYRFENEALIALEENAYRLHKEAYTEESDAVTVYRAAGIYDECDFVARTIRKLIESGYRYRDIAVIARSSDKYAGILDVCLDKYGIRFFQDEPQNIDSMPIVRLVTSAFDIVNRGFQREDVLLLLKTGLCSYTVEEIADFENYLFVWDINGRRFYDPFTDSPEGFADEMTPAQKKQLKRIEALRTDIVAKLRKFARAVNDTDGESIAKALMKLLYELKVDDNISRLCDIFEAQGENERGEDLVRMWTGQAL